MRKFFPSIVLLGFVMFLFWLLIVFVPVLFVEVKYQLKQAFANLGFTTSGSFFKPNTENFTIIGNTSKNKEYGIIVPKLGLDEKVIFNVDPNDENQYRQALKEGIAHASSTKYPDENGLGYYFAHSSSPDFKVQYNAVFYLLNKLEAGDDIYIWHDYKRYRYVVTEKRINRPDDVAFLYDHYEGENIVLQTCWPPGTTKERLLVFATRVKK